MLPESIFQTLRQRLPGIFPSGYACQASLVLDIHNHMPAVYVYLDDLLTVCHARYKKIRTKLMLQSALYYIKLFETQNFWLINESDFKSRAGYNGELTVYYFNKTKNSTFKPLSL